MKTNVFVRSMIGLAAASVIPFFAPMLAQATVGATVTVNVTVSNTHGGTLTAGAVPIFVDGSAATNGSGNIVSASSHVISLTSQSGYTSVIGGDCDSGGNITLEVSDDKACSITLSDIAPQVTVIKHVINDDGLSHTASEFLMQVTATNPSTVNFPGSEMGTVITMDAGTYSINEGTNFVGGETAHGYTKTIGEGCVGTLTVGQTATCTITNDDPDVVPTMGTIRIYKNVINDNGGTKNKSDFVFIVHDSDSETPDVATWIVEEGVERNILPGTFSVTESAFLRGEEVPNTYTATYDEGCSGVISAGQILTCTITNNDPGSPTPPAPSGGGGVPPPIPSDLNPIGFPTPATFVPSPEEPASTPSTGPRVLGVEDSSAANATCRAQDPNAALVTSNLEDLLKALQISRDAALERIATQLAPRVLPADVTQNDRLIIRNFIAYGTSGLTHLGAGERAGVVNSFRAIYHRVPTTECDWQDVLRIAHGMVPLMLSPAREQEAEATFKSVYHRSADRSVSADNQTILIMAYGLRPLERDLSKERLARRVFATTFGHNPRNASEWDTVRGMTYGGLELPAAGR